MLKNLFNYEGKRVVITGAASGMGEATAHLVHSLGAEVVAIDVQPPRYDFARFLEVDLRDSGAIAQAVSEVTTSRVHNLFYLRRLAGWEIFGGRRCDGKLYQPATHDQSADTASAARRRDRECVLRSGYGVFLLWRATPTFSGHY